MVIGFALLLTLLEPSYSPLFTISTATIIINDDYQPDRLNINPISNPLTLSVTLLSTLSSTLPVTMIGSLLVLTDDYW